LIGVCASKAAASAHTSSTKKAAWLDVFVMTIAPLG
jgi:hypothetical protein